MRCFKGKSGKRLALRNPSLINRCKRPRPCLGLCFFRERKTMKINPKKCVACGNCTYVCPMGAIYVDPVINRATVNRDECVECYACFNGLSQEHLNPTFAPPRLSRLKI